MKNWMKWTLGVLAVLALIYFGIFGLNGCTKNFGKSKTEVIKNDSITNAQNNAIRADLSDCKEYSAKMGDSLRWLERDLCSAQNEILRLEDSIFKLNTLLDDCMKGKKKPTAKKAAVRSTPKQTYTPEPQPQKREIVKAYVPATSPGQTENTGLSGDQYIGVYNGSHGVTINEESMLVYFISNEELNAGEGKLSIAAPQLNGQNPNQEFYWDASKKLWIFESHTIITIARLLNSQPIIWSVYIGNHSQWGYPMFLPHEIYKTGSSSARSAMANGEIVQHQNDEGVDYHSLIQYRKK